jgi:rod shape-determining protein MreC
LDKQIRRRRAVLLLLVVVSLILLTAYFGKSPNSPLHSMQRGVATVFSPVQNGASKVLSPVRDIAGFFSSTFNAKSQNKQLHREVASLNTKLAQANLRLIQEGQAGKLANVDTSYGLGQYSPLTASVTAKNPLLWYDTITVDKGTGDGVKRYDPVLGNGTSGGGLVGYVTDVGPGYAVVSLITSPKFAIGAMVEDGVGDAGVLGPKVGNPNTLILSDLSEHADIQAGQQVVTSGFRDPGDPSIHSTAPAGIPIGTVSNQDTQDTLATSQQVDVAPQADIAHLTQVQILIKPLANEQSAQVQERSTADPAS